MKMRSRSDDTCQMDMYTVQSLHTPNILDLPDNMSMLAQHWHNVYHCIGPSLYFNVGPTYKCKVGLRWPNMMASCWPNVVRLYAIHRANVGPLYEKRNPCWHNVGPTQKYLFLCWHYVGPRQVFLIFMLAIRWSMVSTKLQWMLHEELYMINTPERI